MYLRKTISKKTGRTYLAIARSYHDKTTKSSRAEIVKSLGSLEELRKTYPDPIAHFTEVVTKLNAEAAEAKRPEILEYDRTTRLPIDAGERNIGYAVLSAVYHWLRLDVFFNSRQRTLNANYNINSVVKLLVYSRILRPCSKLRAYSGKEWFFDKTDFSVHDVYRALTHIAKMASDAQLWMHRKILEQQGRDMSFMYYDVTNYYFEIDEEDDLRRKGVCKEHRPNPIVQMGLLMDNNGIPVTYKLFPGNNNDCTTLVPILSDVRRKYDAGRVVVVADKGMNTGANAYYIANGRGWYIFSQTVRGGTSELKQFVLKDSGYEWVGKDFKRKSRQYTRNVKIEQGGDKPPIEATISEKQVIFYSRDYDKKAKKDREKAIAKANDIVRAPGKYNKYNTYGAAKYIKNLEYDDKTGEIIQTKSKISFDSKKLKEDEMYDGYYMIVSNCFDKEDDWIIEKYRGLWEIEENFRVTKSELESRPVFVSRQDHIEAHFLTCFIALVIIRLIQKKLCRTYSPETIIDNLSHACCAHIDTNRYMAFHYNKVLKNIGEQYGIDFGKKYWTLQEITKMIGGTKK